MKLSFWDILASMVMLGGLALATIFINIFINPYSFINPFPPPTPVASLQVPTLTPSQRSLPELWTATPETPGVPSATGTRLTSTVTATGTRLVLPTGTATRTRTPSPTPSKSITNTPNRTLTAVAYKSPTQTSDSSDDTVSPSTPGYPLCTAPCNTANPSFSWTASTDSGSGMDHYKITWGTDSGGNNPIYTTDTNSWTAPTITDSAIRYIFVRAVDKAGNESTWSPANSYSYSSYVGLSQVITFTSSAPISPVVGGATYTPTATASSGLTVTFSSGTPAVCTMGGGNVFSFISAGTCIVNANQGGDGTYAPAAQVQQGFVVGQGSQTISFTSSVPVGAVVGGATYSPTATATSGLTVTFTSGAPAVCTVAGGVVTYVGVGTCVVNANQTGNANYTAAPQVPQSFAVGQGSQTITFTSSAPGGAVVGGPTYAVAATGGASGNPVTFTSGTPAVCTVAGSTVSFIGVGPCTVNANQAGNANYAAAPQAQQNFTVGQGAQTITFTSTAPSDAKYNTSSYTVAATGGASGNPVTFSSGAPAVCSVGGSTVTFIGVGTCIVNADQAGNANYAAAPQAQQSFTVSPADTATAVDNGAPEPQTSGLAYTVTATVTSGAGAPTGTVTITDGLGGSCTTGALAGGVGSCSITSSTGTPPVTITLTATYSGDTNFAGSSGTNSHTIN